MNVTADIGGSISGGTTVVEAVFLCFGFVLVVFLAAMVCQCHYTIANGIQTSIAPTGATSIALATNIASQIDPPPPV